jgi:glycosyltransferase involved in cell wall biosynthesis
MIEFITSALRNYNLEFYEKLSRQYSVKFIFTRHGETGEFGGLNVPESWNYENITIKYLNSFYVYDVKNWLRLMIALLRDNYDLIVTSPAEVNFSLLALIISKIRFKKIIFRGEVWHWQSNKITRRLYFYVLIKWMMKQGNAVIAMGEKQHAFYVCALKKKTGIFYMPLYVVPYKKRDVAKFVENLAIDDPKILGKKIILYMGQIIRRKGLDYLIRAFSILEKNLDNTYLLIVGSGEFESSCKKLANDLGIKNIMFKGYSKDSEVELYYNVCDVFVLPSIFLDDYPEPHGYVVYESMSVGKPIVVTDAVGAAQMVRNGINGFVVKNRNTLELADALTKILIDEKLQEKMSNNSIEIFKEKISLEKQLDAFKQAVTFARSEKRR